jgi:hypothetical protein
MKKVKTTKKMKTTKYNYFYYGMPITSAEFEKAVPSSWQDEVDEYGTYSYGGYRAVERDDDEE